MNKSEAKTIREEVQAAVESILAPHGLKLTGCNASFDDTSFNMTIKSSDPDAEIPAWDLTKVGLPPETKAGIRFDYNGKSFEFTGVNTRRPKFPISATDVASGKQYKLPRNAGIAITEAMERNNA